MITKNNFNYKKPQKIITENQNLNPIAQVSKLTHRRGMNF